MEKTCKICGQTKPCAKGQAKTSGFMGLVCWVCYLAADRTRKTAEHATADGRLKFNARSLAWYAANPGKATAKTMRYYTAKRRRIPPWADLNAIKLVYMEAAKQGLEVDHIYPLQGALVSGLHVANNLQLLPATENSKKGNKMPAAGQIN